MCRVSWLQPHMAASWSSASGASRPAPPPAPVREICGAVGTADNYNEVASFSSAGVLKHCRVVSQPFQFCFPGSYVPRGGLMWKGSWAGVEWAFLDAHSLSLFVSKALLPYDSREVWARGWTSQRPFPSQALWALLSRWAIEDACFIGVWDTGTMLRSFEVCPKGCSWAILSQFSRIYMS